MSKILVLIENDLTRRLISSILSNKDYIVAEGIANLEENNFETVIIDKSNSSYDLQFSLINQIPRILIVTDESLGSDENIITKPIVPEQLLGAVAKTSKNSNIDDLNPNHEKHIPFMQRAIDLSMEKMIDNYGGPFGAVVVRNGIIIGEGWDSVAEDNDPTSKAVLMAIRNACKRIENFTLSGCDLYTNSEPEPMSLAAIYWARIDKVFYSNTRSEAAEIGFDDQFIYDDLLQRPEKRIMPLIRIENMADDAYDIFRKWTEKENKTEY